MPAVVHSTGILILTLPTYIPTKLSNQTFFVVVKRQRFTKMECLSATLLVELLNFYQKGDSNVAMFHAISGEYGVHNHPTAQGIG